MILFGEYLIFPTFRFLVSTKWDYLSIRECYNRKVHRIRIINWKNWNFNSFLFSDFIGENSTVNFLHTFQRNVKSFQRFYLRLLQILFWKYSLIQLSIWNDKNWFDQKVADKYKKYQFAQRTGNAFELGHITLCTKVSICTMHALSSKYS